MLRRGLLRRARLQTVFDVLHLFVLEGPRIRIDDVIAYVHRATSRRPATPRSQHRAFERVKQRLRALGVSVRSDEDPDGTRFVSIPRAAKAKARLERDFERVNPPDPDAY